MNQLTQHFGLAEFELGHELSVEEINKAFLFCLFVLEPVRARFGTTLITDFKRTPEDTLRLVDAGYTPSATSEHLICEAVDFTCVNTNMKEVFSFLVNELKWPGQVELDLVKAHVHVGWPRMGIAPNHFIRGEQQGETHA